MAVAQWAELSAQVSLYFAKLKMVHFIYFLCVDLLYYYTFHPVIG